MKLGWAPWSGFVTLLLNFQTSHVQLLSLPDSLRVVCWEDSAACNLHLLLMSSETEAC